MRSAHSCRYKNDTYALGGRAAFSVKPKGYYGILVQVSVCVHTHSVIQYAHVTMMCFWDLEP